MKSEVKSNVNSLHFPTDLAQLKTMWNSSRCLRTADEVHQAVDRVAEHISQDLKNLDPMVICIMNGGLIFCGQLLVRLPFAVQLDYLQVSRYRNNTQGGVLNWLAEPHQLIQDRHILLVDDILDEGDTLLAASEYVLERGASSLKTAVLVDKQHTRKCKPDFKADYTGFTLEDGYLFGCGMDYQGYFRNLDAIYAAPNELLAGNS